MSSSISTEYRTASDGTSSTTKKGKGYNALEIGDFVKLMMTQLQNQDPMNPTSNAELMSQMSQIGQMQNNSAMKDLLSALTLQNQIGSAGNLIGKSVTGISNKEPVTGRVESVSIADGKVSLVLSSGLKLGLNNVTNIAQSNSGT